MKPFTLLYRTTVCIVAMSLVVGTSFAQDLRLFRQQDGTKRTDSEAIQAWWRDLQGDGGPTLKIQEIKETGLPGDFEVKLTGDWINCEKIAALRAPKSRTVIAKIQATGGGKSKTMTHLFLISDGEVAFSSDTWKKR